MDNKLDNEGQTMGNLISLKQKMSAFREEVVQYWQIYNNFKYYCHIFVCVEH